MTPDAGVVVVRLSGELEIGRKEAIRSALQVRGTEAAILVDFSDVTYADSTALAELFRFRADAQRHRIPVAILIGSRQFARIIQYAGLVEAFRVFQDRSEALAYLIEARAS